MDKLIASSAFLLGFSGSLHCFGMCGPIAFSIALDRKNKMKMILGNFIYQMGRILTYTFFGFLFGGISYGFSLAGFQRKLSIILGAAMILSVFFSKRKFNALRLKPYSVFLKKLKAVLGKFMYKKKFSSLFVTGILNGLLPCGLVYLAIAGAMATGDGLLGGFFMFLFGLGTTPLMFSVVIMGNFINVSIKKKIAKVLPIASILLGALLITRGIGLGIPYLSPSKEVLSSNTKKNSLKKAPGGCH